MANHASAVKAHRQSLKRRARNKSHRSALRTALKKAGEQLTAGKISDPKASMARLYTLVDKAIQKKVLSKNAAARQKSRFMRRLNSPAAGASKG